MVITDRPTDLEAAVRQFLERRGLPGAHPLLETALIGDPARCHDLILQYRGAGVTDFTLSFADFPSSAMLRLFAEQVLLYLPE